MERTLPRALKTAIAASAILVTTMGAAAAQQSSTASNRITNLQSPDVTVQSVVETAAASPLPKSFAPEAASAHMGHGHGVNATDSTILCVADLAMVADRARVNFQSASATLSRNAQEGVLVLASLAQNCPQAQIIIEGFADPIGNSAYNLSLSWRRANAVMSTIKAAGFSTENFKVYSHLTDHDDAVCKHFDVVDRRVEFIVVPRTRG